MEAEEIISNNTMIADFMGYIHSKFEDMDIWEMSKLGYHANWNHLIMVVEKIESLATDHIDKVYVSINGKSCMIWNYYDPVEVIRTIGSGSTYKIKKVAETKLLATYEAVVDFVKWYNTLNTKQSSE